MRPKSLAVGAQLILFVACQATIPATSEATKILPDITASPTAPATVPSIPGETEIPISEESPSLPPSGQLVERVDVGERNIFAITIDDGYGKMPFDVILDELRNRDVQATFFLVGIASINLGEERLAQLVDDGHTIAYHSYAHEDLGVVATWSEADWLQDYSKWEKTMKSLLGERRFSHAYRPYARAPYGLFNFPFMGMTQELNLVPIGWSNDPGDLNRGIVLKAGDIFLLHVRYPDAEILPEILDDQILEIVSLDELFAAQSAK